MCGKKCVYISVAKQPFEGPLLKHTVATLKEMFDLPSKVLEVFNSLLEPKVTTEDEQIPMEITEMDSNIDFKITI